MSDVEWCFIIYVIIWFSHCWQSWWPKYIRYFVVLCWSLNHWCAKRDFHGSLHIRFGIYAQPNSVTKLFTMIGKRSARNGYKQLASNSFNRQTTYGQPHIETNIYTHYAMSISFYLHDLATHNATINKVLARINILIVTEYIASHATILGQMIFAIWGILIRLSGNICSPLLLLHFSIDYHKLVHFPFF